MGLMIPYLSCLSSSAVCGSYEVQRLGKDRIPDTRTRWMDGQSSSPGTNWIRRLIIHHGIRRCYAIVEDRVVAEVSRV
jgi:hypothetical protein